MLYSPLFSGLRRLGRGLGYELFQVALWVAFALHALGSLRSAFGGGGENAAQWLSRRARAVRPRRPEARRRAGFTYPAAA